MTNANAPFYGLNPADLITNTYPPEPTSGMRVGMRNGVHMTHRPTGLFVAIDTERSQHANRDKALRALAEMVAKLPAAERPTPAGFVLVPKHLTAAMNDVLNAEEGWKWADLLAAAEVITEAEHEAILAFDTLDQLADAQRATKGPQSVAEWQARARPRGQWRRIDPPRGETVDQRVAYLRSLTHADGSPAYEVRALYEGPAA